MTRFLMLMLVVAAAATGCRNGSERYSNAVDPCWPERYSHEARVTTLQPFQAQASNGQILSQTVWNYHFESGTDVLTRAGQATLDQIVQKRPSTDGRIYLQTTRDVAYDAGAPEKLADTRRDLDGRRAVAVQKYLAAQTAARPVNFEVQVIDPSDPAINSRYSLHAVNALPGKYGASLGAGGGGVGGGAGGSSGTSGVGGGPSQ